MTLGLKFLLRKIRNFLFQKISSIQIFTFNCNKMYSCETMGKGACLKRMVAVRNYSTNIIIEKNKQRENGGGGGLRMWNFHGSSKKLKCFSGKAHSVLISLGHFDLSCTFAFANLKHVKQQ